MDHATIERDSVIERYLLGQLPRQEEEAFEEHLLGCSSCLRQLEEAEDFQTSLRAAVAGEMTRGAVRAGFFGWFQRRGQLASAMLLGLFLVVVPSSFLWWQGRQLDEQLSRPRANPLLVTLSATRGGGADSSGASFEDFTEIRTRGDEDVVLAFELALIEHDTYHFSLQAASGEPLYEDALRPDSDGRLAVSFPASFLSPGDYLVRISVPSSEGGTQSRRRVLSTCAVRVVAETP